MSTLNAVIFRNHAAESAGKKFLSLFPGLGYAAGYKILQRVYKYGPGLLSPSLCRNADVALLRPGLEDSRTPTTTSSESSSSTVSTYGLPTDAPSGVLQRQLQAELRERIRR